MNTYNVELTDTFGGEANYSWAKRATVSVPEWGDVRSEPKGYQARVMRKAKAAVGMTGVRGTTERVGDGYEFRPYGMLLVMFVTFED